MWTWDGCGAGSRISPGTRIPPGQSLLQVSIVPVDILEEFYLSIRQHDRRGVNDHHRAFLCQIHLL